MDALIPQEDQTFHSCTMNQKFRIVSLKNDAVNKVYVINNKDDESPCNDNRNKQYL